MDRMISTTPFGQRPLSLGQIAAQMQVTRVIEEAGKPGSNHPAAVNKWQIFRTLTEIRERLGVSDRALSVLHALLSFHQETALTLPKPRAGQQEAEGAVEGQSNDLIVFPSNKALSLRANGMAAATLRRHIAMLVEAGLIIRRDSPNGKRYARKDITGAERFSDAFGFDLTPLVTRAPQFESMADDVKHLARTRAITKERITLLRRDVSKMITCGLDEGLPGDWEAYRERFMRLVTPLRRILEDQHLDAISSALTELRNEVSNSLQSQINTSEMSGNHTHSERHQSNTNSQYPTDFEPAYVRKTGGISENSLETKSSFKETEEGGKPDDPNHSSPVYSLGMVLEACPDVKDYGASGAIRTWPAFLEAVRLIRPMLGISPDAWRNARAALGEIEAHIVVASILQRSEYSSEAVQSEEPKDGKTAGSSITTINGSPAIKSAGGYLRTLTEKAGEGAFALGPVLMALIGQRLKAKRGR